MREMYMHGSRQLAIEGPYHSVQPPPPGLNVPLRHE